MSLKQGIEDKMAGLALEGVDVIFITDKYVFDRIKKMKFPGVTKPIQMILVPDLSNVKAMSIRDMRKAGWERVETLEKLAAKQAEIKELSGMLREIVPAEGVE